MGDPPIIRKLSEKDIAAVTAIQAQAVLEGVANFDLVPLSEAQMAEMIDDLRKRSCPAYVAEINGKVAGFATAGPYRTRPAYRWSLENSIYVSPAFQGHGVGSALLLRIIEKAEISGFRQMVAIITKTENTASVALHKKHGFQMTGTLFNVGFKHGRWLDTVIMQLALGKGSKTPPEEEL